MEIDAALNWADEVWAAVKSNDFCDPQLTMSERCHVHTLAYEYRQARAQGAKAEQERCIGCLQHFCDLCDCETCDGCDVPDVRDTILNPPAETGDAEKDLVIGGPSKVEL